MSIYTSISVIYNPKSTGNSKQLATEFKKDLRKQSITPIVNLIETKHAGHAEQLAYDIAKKSKHPLIVSASGDGGYNEMINGLMKAREEGANPIAGLLPAGNANDYYENTHITNVASAILKKKTSRADLLILDVFSGGQKITRYAHSYIGIGLTPQTGQELNKIELNLLREVWIVLKALRSLRSVKILVKGKTYHYDSLIFSNIRTMSKVLSLSRHSSINDGLFEVTAFRRRNKFRLIRSLIKAATVGLEGKTQVKNFSFTTTKKTLVQCDGEILELDSDSRVHIKIAPHALYCIL